jgi:phospholipid transport system substrate-binding protein
MHEVTDDILNQLKASPEITGHRSELIGLIRNEIFPHVDFTQVARLMLGQHWDDADDTQRKRFVATLRGLLACTYSAAFTSYAGQKIEWRQPLWSSERDHVEIRARILQKGEAPLAVAYRLSKGNGQWKLYDLVVEDVSLVANYRSTFSDRLQNEDLDALVDELAAHNAQGCGSDG